MNTNEFRTCDKMYSVMDKPFPEWLIEELKQRDWNYSDLARKAGISRGSVGNIIRGERSPGADICEAIAHAFGLPVETVFRAAGLLPDLPTPRDQYEELLAHRLSLLTDDQLADVLKYVEFISTREQKPIKTTTTQKREGERPPEVVKKPV